QRGGRGRGDLAEAGERLRVDEQVAALDARRTRTEALRTSAEPLAGAGIEAPSMVAADEGARRVELAFPRGGDAGRGEPRAEAQRPRLGAQRDETDSTRGDRVRPLAREVGRARDGRPLGASLGLVVRRVRDRHASVYARGARRVQGRRQERYAVARGSSELAI